MTLHLSTFLILTGLTGVYSITTVTKVSVKARDSISIPCQYSQEYTNHVKYLCKGFYYNFCSNVVDTNQQRSGRFFISDDRKLKIFTVTVKDVTEGDTHFWCVVMINGGKDDAAYFLVSVTTGVSPLYVDQQKVTGFIGEETTIKCYYQNPGETKWCRVGGPCVTQSWGSMDRTTAFIDQTAPGVLRVTMRGLKMEDSGWYWCIKGDLQMPVHLSVREKLPSTAQSVTSLRPELVNFTVVESVTISERENSSTTDEDVPSSVSGSFMSLIISLSLLVFIVIVSLFMWFCIKRQNAIQEESSAVMLAQDEVTSSNVMKKGESSPRPLWSENEVVYSSVTIPEQRHRPLCSETEVTYSSVKIPGRKRRTMETTDIYSNMTSHKP